MLDDGTQHQTTINGAPSGSTITITDALPSQADTGNNFVKAVDFSGVDTKQVSVITWGAFDSVYIANGTDTPHKFDGSTCEAMTGFPSTPFIADLVYVQDSYLCFAGLSEAGTSRPWRVRWSDAGLDNAFTSTNFTDLVDTEDWIIAGAPLGNAFIIYKENSIYRQEFLGTDDQTWNFVPTIPDEGVSSLYSVVPQEDHHIIFGRNDIYRYEGGFDLISVGQRIKDKIFGSRGELNIDQLTKIIGIEVVETKEIWFIYPKTGDDDPQNVIRYHLEYKRWTEREFSFPVTGFGLWRDTTATAWNALIGTWQQQTYPWVSKQSLGGVDSVILGDGSSLNSYEYDYTTSDDAGTAISYTIETKDFNLPNKHLRTDRFEYFLRCVDMLIEYSVDQGVTWNTLGTVTSPVSASRQRLWKQFVGTQVRFKFTGSSDLLLQWIAFVYKEETGW